MEQNLAVIQQAYDNLQAGELDACAELLTEDFIANLPGLPEPVRGRDVWRLGAEAMLAGFPDLRVEISEMFAAGDKVTVLLRFHGTHTGPFQGVAPTYRPVNFRSIEVYRLTDGKIAEEWVAPDLTALMSQLTVA